MINYVENANRTDSAALQGAYGYAAGLSACVLVWAVLHHLYFYRIQRVGMRLRVAVCHMIYRKVFCLSSSAMGKTTTGQIVNLLSNDVNRFDQVTMFLHYLSVGPLQAIAVTALLWMETGISCLAGMAVLIFLLLLQSCFGMWFSSLRSKTAALTDDRIRTMNEFISGIRTVKMYAWEKSLIDLITSLRRKEISKILQSSYLRGMNLASFFAVTKIMIFVTFATNVAFNKNFLLLDEISQLNTQLPSDDKTIVYMKDFTAFWDKESETPTLQGLSFTVRPGELLAVVGPVGAGKSSLLHALLGELPPSQGQVSVHGRIVYVSQQPWVFSGTVRSNILFGKKYEEERYEKVIKACALEETETIQVTFPLEGRSVGRVGFKSYENYFTAGDHWFIIIFLILVNIAAQVSYILQDWWLAYWANRQSTLYAMAYGKGRVVEIPDSGWYLTVHSVLTEGTILYGITRSLLIFYVLVNSSQTLHNKMLKSIFRAPMLFFDRNPIGRILNRFSKDIGDMDDLLPLTFLDFIQSLSVDGPPNNLFQDLMRDFAKDVTSSSVLCLRIAFTDVPILVDCNSSRVMGIFLSSFSKSNAPAAFFFCTILSIFLAMGITWSSMAPAGLPRARPCGMGSGRSWRVAGEPRRLRVIGVVGVMVAAIPWIGIPAIPLGILFVILQRYFLETSQDVKRLECTTWSLVFSHLSSSLQGLWTIRAYKAKKKFQELFDAHQDLHSEAWFLLLTTSRWVAVYLDITCAIFVIVVAFGSLIMVESLTPGQVGLVLSLTLTLTGMFQWCVRQSAEVENMMISVERVIEYTDLEKEAPWELEYCPPPSWPPIGGISFSSVNFRYNSDSPLVLRNLEASIYPREKYGIVGRTGAGKSSLIAALFRLSEPEGGIYIDGVLTTGIGLHDLRKKMSVALQVQLKESIEGLPAKMNTELAESGLNLSAGQKQLVCLARALLRKNQILILDKATSYVDPRTDEFIQKRIRERFAQCTVLTISHRLSNIIDCEWILVLDSGKRKEHNQPNNLLQDRNSQFYKMVQELGKEEAAVLAKRAK
ncbi:hypothetical protein MJG53_010008 [Ovis ammon polii x Ovis aries]|uniref:Uncharacterized protein n=1 Tax=Ovis ammon polii x Ovis aries TaxID=2918886 RepID=A0ACB9UWK0_9CETA|nr:hypothetical protein MJG53_010008 [Ovis ammon polii x Ovis aries]